VRPFLVIACDWYELLRESHVPPWQIPGKNCLDMALGLAVDYILWLEFEICHM
jgi:hypothetical protein